MIALLALLETELSLSDLESALERIVPAESAPEVTVNGDYLRTVIGDVELRLAHHPKPISRENLEGPCRTAWYWPEAAEALSSHRSQIVVAIKKRGAVPPVSNFWPDVAAEVAEDDATDDAAEDNPGDNVCVSLTARDDADGDADNSADDARV